MNIVFLSPHFPPNYYLFPLRLREFGVNVLGVADADYQSLRPELRQSLTEYYKVADMHNYDELVRAFGLFTHRYGKIDRVDSFNEYWLETEAKLRTDFNILGVKSDTIQRIKRKSLMKARFRQAKVAVAEGEAYINDNQAWTFVRKFGFPIIAKPDIGVGASQTYKITSDTELTDFLQYKNRGDYFLEQFIEGKIQSFDGLTDRDGKMVFFTAHEYSRGVLEAVNEDFDIFYYSFRDIPEDLENAGKALVDAFEVKERFFHFEFFRKEDGSLVGLEVNMRPPGGLTTDMYNYANDFDIYHEWASLVTRNKFTAKWSRPYHVVYVGRKKNKNYRHSHDEIAAYVGDHLILREPISGVFSQALGNDGYLLRSPDKSTILEYARFIQEKME